MSGLDPIKVPNILVQSRGEALISFCLFFFLCNFSLIHVVFRPSVSGRMFLFFIFNAARVLGSGTGFYVGNVSATVSKRDGDIAF